MEEKEINEKFQKLENDLKQANETINSLKEENNSLKNEFFDKLNQHEEKEINFTDLKTDQEKIDYFNNLINSDIIRTKE